jgi:ERCC4-type nuclease
MGRVVRIDDREKDFIQDRMKPVFENDDDIDEVKVERMKAGDIVCRGIEAGIERKAITDFLSSVGNNRIWKQKDKMDQMYEHNCIIIEGSHIKDFVADIHGGHAHSIKMVIGTCAWLNNQDGWSGFWIQSNEKEGTRLLCHYASAWFKQVEKARNNR